MPFCSNCGKQLDAEARFCTSCGTPVIAPAVLQNPALQDRSAPAASMVTQGAAAAAPDTVTQPELDPTVAVPMAQVPGEQMPVMTQAQPVYQAPACQQYNAPQPQMYSAPTGVGQQYQPYWHNVQGQPAGRAPAYIAAQQPVQPAVAPAVKTKKGTAGGKKGGKKPLVIGFLMVALVAAAVVGLVLGGVLPLGGELEAYAGVYECVSASNGRKTLDVDDLFEDGSQIILKGSGKGSITMDDAESALKWTLEDDEITLSFEDGDFAGTLSHGSIVVEIEGLTYTYVNEELREAAYSVYAGSYKIVSAKINGKKTALEDAGLENVYLILEDDGTAIVVDSSDGETYFAAEESWQPGMILLNGIECELSIEDEELVLEGNDGDKVVLTFESVSARKVPAYEIGEPAADNGDTTTEGTASAEEEDDPGAAEEQPSDAAGTVVETPVVPAEEQEEEPAKTPAEAPVEVPSQTEVPDAATGATPVSDSAWYGDWYGWWAAYDVVGEELDFLIDMTWDCYATIDVFDENILYLSLWDDDWYLGEMEMLVIEEDNYANCAGGYFLDADIAGDEFVMMRMDEELGCEDKLIIIMGTYANSETGESFKFEVWLRPWGASWSDLSGHEPPYYFDWYLPMLEKGYLMPGGLYGGTNDWEIDGFTPN